jgi:hypothetical protein
MAEVRALPSAVGAFEAQVLNTTGAYNYLMKQAAEQKKQSAALRKQLEDNMNTALSDKRLIRAQDDPYITSLKVDLENYYSQNRDAIIDGGTAFNEYKRKLGKVTSEISRSISIKEKGTQLASYALRSIDPTKGTTYSKAFGQALSVFELPINDERRVNYTFTNDFGEPVGIDQLSVNELDRFAYFRLERLDDAIRNIKPYEYKTTSLVGGKDVTTYRKVTPPKEIYGAVFNVANTYTDFIDTYSKVSKAEQDLYSTSYAPLSERMNKSLQEMNKFYQSTGTGEILSLFEKNDNTVGVDPNNPFEYALFQKLWENMPKDMGMSYSYMSETNYRAAKSLELQIENQAWKRAQNQSIDSLIIDDINNGKFKAGDWERVINAFTENQEAALGNIVPSTVNFSDDGKTMVVMTFKPLYNQDGSIVSDLNQAKNIVNTSRGRGSGNAVNIEALPGGLGYGAKEITTLNIDKSINGWQANLVNGLNIAQSAIINETTRRSLEQARKYTSQNLIEELNR